MFFVTWILGLLRHKSLRLGAATAGIAISVAFLAVMAGFIASTRAGMTDQALADVAIDWQIQLASPGDLQTAIDALNQSPGAEKLYQVNYFDTPGFQTTTGSTVQTTGAGKVLGYQSGYPDAFPEEIRFLAGSGSVLLAQQTAANLHAEPGTTISIMRPGLAPVEVQVDAVIDLPLADSLFQVVGAPSGSAPQAPPDNVLLMPLDQWQALFSPVAAVDPNALHTQLHAVLPHNLPSDPSAAFTEITGQAQNYEVRTSGGAVVGDNLAARLDAARADALYVQLLFLFLGLPGVIVAGLLTTILITSRAAERRREQALLRIRGGSLRRLVAVAGSEAAVIGGLGSAIGLLLASLTVRLSFGHWGFGNSTFSGLGWALGATGVGLLIAFLAVLISAWRDANSLSVSASRRSIFRQGLSIWERTGIDLVLLAISGYIFWRASRGGYHLVLAPEGVPRVSVSYSALLAPLLLWIGGALLIVRLSRLVLARDGQLVIPLIRPLGKRLAPLVGGSLSRQRRLVATGLMLVALSVAFATSTAIFNSTYEAQSLVDAQLTNGADVTVRGPESSNLLDRVDAIQQLPGVTNVAPMQHRFAYVGTDLQDMYGIDPATIGQAAQLSDAFFVGDSADTVLARLASTPDGVLVSPETVFDFQLQPGDLIRLRLQDAQDHQYHIIPFHYVGIAREFPTAPSDSFLVANSAYVAAQTHSTATETLLIRTQGSPTTVANDVRALLGATSGATVMDINQQRQITNSSLTAVSLHGLTRIELGLAILLAAGAGGLVLVLGLESRRRTLAIATALGAKSGQLGAFVWSEVGLIVIGGLVAGSALGWSLVYMLTKLLTGVFDPPPTHNSIPWIYLAVLLVVTAGSGMLAGYAAVRLSLQDILESIRRL